MTNEDYQKALQRESELIELDPKPNQPEWLELIQIEEKIISYEA